MQLLFSYVARHKKVLFGALILATINQVFSLLDPQIFRLVVDNYASRAGELTRTEFLHGVLLLIAGLIGVAFVSRVAKNFQDYYVNVITRRVGAQLYGDTVAHSFSLPYAVFEDTASGTTLQTLSKARIDAQALISSFVNTIFLSLVTIVFVLAYAFWVHWSVGLAYATIIPTVGATTFYITRAIKKTQTQIVSQTAELAGSTTETLRNVELVKSLGLEQQETDRLNAVNSKILTLELQKIKLIRGLSFAQGTLINAVRSSILLLMLWLVFTKTISLGQFFSLWIYSFFIFTPLAELGNIATQYQETSASMDQLRKILNIEPVQKPEHPVVIPDIAEIAFDNVSFGYDAANPSTVSRISLSIKKGTSVAFAGPSGAGKSTLVKLLVGLYRPTQGAVLVNGVDLTTVDSTAFRARIGYVSQETQLFAGTIKENLLFVQPSATDSQCLQALSAASADSIIARSPQGLDTKIGEGGVKISGGERQRLAIARALLRNPDIIIFDEATSSLDSITEKAITETIQKIAKSHPHLIIVMIAHRLSTIAHADAIYVMERGKNIESGTHSDLIKKPSGLYHALWRQQSGIS
jgi:ATP-binding cassette subfamily B protein